MNARRGREDTGFLRRRLRRNPPPTAPKGGPSDEEAVLVHLDGKTLPEEIYAEFDLATLEDQLEAAIAERQVGDFDGNEIGPDEATLFMYGPHADRLFVAVEQILREYPLCRNARVTIRAGGPGAPEREVRL